MFQNVFLHNHSVVDKDLIAREATRRGLSDVVFIYPVSSNEWEAMLSDRGRFVTFGPIKMEFYARSNHARLEPEDAIKQLGQKRDPNETYYALTRSSPVSFVSLGHEMMSYRKLVDEIGPDVATEFLLALHDLMALKQYRPNSVDIRNVALNRRHLKRIVLSPEEMQIYLRGHQILTMSERAAISLSQPHFRMGFKSRSSQIQDVTFEFGTVSDLGARTAVLIGKNGIGKSHFLREVANLMLEPSHDLFADPQADQFRSSRLLCFFTGPRVSKAFPRQTAQRRHNGYRVFNLQDDPRSNNVRAIDAVIELITADETIAERKRLTIFQESVKSVRKNEPLYIWHDRHGPIDVMRVRFDDDGGIGAVEYFDIAGNKHRQSLEEFAFIIDTTRGLLTTGTRALSSGEEAYVRFCAFSSLHIENGSAVLMDEPEVYLHPQFIDALMGALHRLLELTGSVAFISTHSAYVVRCAEENLVYLMREPIDGFYPGLDIEFTKPRMRTFGADVGMISLFVFGEDEMATTEDRARAYASLFTLTNSAEEIVRVLESRTSPDLISKILNANASRH
ncbi:MAG: AAA family ATPase [Shinella sp.]|uniref:AAA family ATPase n=1 Tax=Shinella sp. TaxID=1870904 RepID=UPI004036FC94